MSNRKPFDNNDDDDEQNDPPSEDEIREILKQGAPILNIEGFISTLRKDAIKEFNKRFKKEQLQISPNNINPDAKRWTNDLLDEIITASEILEIFERTLEWSDEHQTFIIYESTLWKLYDEICRKIFFDIGENLTNAGIFELRFDRTLGNNGDFTFVLSQLALKKATAAAKKLEKQEKLALKNQKVQDEVKRVAKKSNNIITPKKRGRPKKGK